MRQAELIFIPSPGIGHLVSTLEFAKRLIDRDDRLLITILTMKFPFIPLADAFTRSVTASQPRIQLIDLPQVDPPPSELWSSPENYLSSFIESNIPNVKDTITKIVSSKSTSDSAEVAALVLDFFCVSMIDVGRELGLHAYLFLTSNAGFLGLMLYLPIRHDQTSIEFSDSDPESVIPGFVNPVPTGVMPSAVSNKDGGYTTYIKLARRFRDAEGIIVNTFTELEPYALDSFFNGQTPPVYAVGPVLDLIGQPHPGLDQAQRDNIMKWLDDQPPSSVVFLCFGSMGSFGTTQVKEIALGLEHSGHRFLWCLRESPSNDTMAEGFLERIKGKGMICGGWAPQVEVVAHKATGGFVSHCGWNSILESLWHGIPIVTWPIYAEQQLNAFRMVKELGLAVEMRLDYRNGDLVMADEIERAIRRLMECDNEVRKKVKEMGEMARKAVMEGGSAFISVGQLIEDMMGSSS
ncbi:UDP-glycosyltransferase 71C4 [Morella rubra]|uniref:Glycosyltransferase n=1 Tax=Morella rubra TaxID=262757 RepID=A0A6A1VFP7_9ROSI|nr:UDP-glycosyltransferase 71C4 [Morella rubra]KAB1227738.1 UDP-glycosyltransferase 71C4 [Morella rubra]